MTGKTHRHIWPLLLLLSALTGCGPPMIDYDGNKVFNPDYVYFLEWSPRDRWQMPEGVVAALEIPEAAVVADVGAGGGYFTRRFAERVGPAGHVYATDVQPAMIEELRTRVISRHYDNVDVVLGRSDDPTLPAGCCDLVFFANVYKEIHDRPAYMRKIRAALRSGGRVAIIGFAPDGPRMGPPRKVRLSAEQVVEELAQAGFALAATHDFLPRQYFLVFEPLL